MIIAIKQDDLDKWWPFVSQFIEKALVEGYGEYDIHDIHTLLEDGNATLILAINDNKVVAGIIVTLIEKPALRELIGLTAGGDSMDQWLGEMSIVFDRIAKEQQADVICIHGRRGWVRKLQKYNYKEVYTTVMKRL